MNRRMAVRTILASVAVATGGLTLTLGVLGYSHASEMVRDGVLVGVGETLVVVFMARVVYLAIKGDLS